MTASDHADGQRRHRPGLSPPAVYALAYLLGSVPFSNLAARVARGVDLRTVGSGTVSGSGLYEVTGFPFVALAGSLDVAKGAVATALAGSRRPRVRAAAAGLAVSGHNWSPMLGGAGGRGLAPALGATLVLAPEATGILAIGLGGGRLIRRTGAGCFWAILALTPVLAATRGRVGLFGAGAVAAPLLSKRLLGNGLPDRPDLALLLNRLVLDRDQALLPPTAPPIRGGSRHRGSRRGQR